MATDGAASMNLHVEALAALMAPDPATKSAAVDALRLAFAEGRAVPGDTAAAIAITAPGRPTFPLLVPPRELAHRGLGTLAGRIALIHAVAHIEFNAINLALDAVYRFRDLPADYYADWLSVAVDEARHFNLLRRRLVELGSAYGALPAHNGLWEAACASADSCLKRMALVPRVLEARGLDVTPGMIDRLNRVGDRETVAILETILEEEVGHVRIGTRWFRHCCSRAGVDPEPTFLALVAEHSRASIRAPFNRESRRRAGFAVAEQAGLDAMAGASDR